MATPCLLQDLSDESVEHLRAVSDYVCMASYRKHSQGLTLRVPNSLGFVSKAIARIKPKLLLSLRQVRGQSLCEDTPELSHTERGTYATAHGEVTLMRFSEA